MNALQTSRALPTHSRHATWVASVFLWGLAYLTHGGQTSGTVNTNPGGGGSGSQLGGGTAGDHSGGFELNISATIQNNSSTTRRYQMRLANLTATAPAYTTTAAYAFGVSSSCNAGTSTPFTPRWVGSVYWGYPNSVGGAPTISSPWPKDVTATINGIVQIVDYPSGRLVYSETISVTPTFHCNTASSVNTLILPTMNLGTLPDNGSSYYQVVFNNRTVPAAGGTLQGSVYEADPNTAFQFAPVGTAWLTAQNGGAGTTSSTPDPVTGMYVGTAAFTAAAATNWSYAGWFDSQGGSVTIRGQAFDVTQESGGYRFKEAAVHDSDSQIVSIGYEKGQQSTSEVRLQYRVNGGSFVDIPTAQLSNSAGSIGTGVQAGNHNLTWDASSLVDAKDQDLSVELKVSEPNGYYAISEPFKLKPSCEGCKNCAQAANVATEVNDSVKVSVSVGKDALSRSYGQLWIKEKIASDQLRTPAALLREAYHGAQTYPANSANFTQVRTPAVLVEISDPNPNDSTWTIKAYDQASQLGTFNAGTGLYDQSGKTPFQTITFTVTNNANGTFQSFTAQESGVYGDRQHVFTWSPDAQGNPGWFLDQIDPTFGLLRRERISETTSANGLTRTTDRQIFEPDGTTLADRLITTTQNFAFGERVIQEQQFIVRENGTTAGSRSTFHTYQTTEGQSGYGQLAETYTDFDASWTSYSYNANGLAQTLRTYRNAGRGSNVGDLDATTITWETGEFGLGPLQDLASITTRTLAGQAVSRTVDVFFRDKPTATLSDGQTPYTYEEKWSIVLTDPAVTTVAGALSSPTALITKTRTYASGSNSGQVRSVLRPDGTITISEVSGSETITWNGAAAADGNSVTAGTRQNRVVNEYGQLVSSQTVDLASQLTIDEQLTLTHDSLGRPTEIQHLGGTHTYASYTCCGLESETDRTGIVTSYVRDMLGRVHSQTRLGITTSYTLSALGMVRSTTDSAGGSNIPRNVTHSDNLGVETTSIDAMNRSTGTVETFAANGARTVTTTHPDGSTRIETFYLDGAPFTVTGTGVYPAKYESGADADGRFTKTIRLGDSGQETEWITTYTDFAGRSGKTVQAHESGTPAVSQVFYNAKGQLVQTVDPDGVSTLFEYNSLGEQVTSAVDVDQDGEIDRGGNDRVTETASSYATRSGKTARRTVEQGYLTDGNATPTPWRISETSVDGLDTWSTLAGLTTHSSTQLQGNGNSTVTVTNPDGTPEVTVITGGHRTSLTRLDSTAGQVTQTTYSYDSYGRVSSQTDARTGTTTFTWFNDGQMASTTTPAPGDGSAAQTTSFTYDANGRPDTTTLPDSGVVDQDYSSTGNLLHQEGARTYPVTYTYDSQGRMRTMTTAGGVTTWNYHAASGRLAQKIHGDGHGPAYTYTPAGRVITRTSGRGIVTTYAYNPAGDLAGIDYSDDTPDVAYTSTRRGQIATATKSGNVTTYSYNSAGQAELESVDGGVLTGVSVAPGYDALLRRTTLNASGPGWNFQQSYAYDQAGRLGTIASGNQSATYGYVANSNLLATTQSATGGNTILSTTRTWDNLNRLQAISNAANALNQSFAYTYNAANQRTKVTREDDTYWDYGYDTLGQVTGAVQKQSGGTPYAARTFGYGYDNIGTRTSATFSVTGANNYTIGYTKASGDGTQYATISNPGVALVAGEADPAASVTVNGVAAQARQSSHFAHELTLTNTNGPAAQAVDISATSGTTTETEQRHAFVPAQTANLTYDLDGNLTFDGFLEYTWDAENRLLTVRTRPGLAPVGSSLKDFRQEMVYDHAGRRIRRTTYYTVSGTEHRATDDLFVYDGWNQIAVLDAGTRLPRQTFVWGLDLSGTLQGAGGVGGLALIRDVPSATNHFVSYDGNGNVMGLADAATGDQTADYLYDAFGNLLAAKGAFAMRNPWRFSTKVQDEASGLYYYGYRYYDPNTGRWMSRDPIAEQGFKTVFIPAELALASEDGGISLNPQALLQNDPVTYYDNLGLAPGQPYPTPQQAIDAALADADAATKLTISIGKREYRGRIPPNAPPSVRTNFRVPSSGAHHRVGPWPDTGHWARIFGVEYGTIVYSFSSNSGTLLYSYNDLIKGHIDWKGNYYGAVTFGKWDPIAHVHYNHKSKLCRKVAGIHTHSFEVHIEGEADPIGDTFSDGDMAWARGNEIPIWLIDRKGKAKQWDPITGK